MGKNRRSRYARSDSIFIDDANTEHILHARIQRIAGCRKSSGYPLEIIINHTRGRIPTTRPQPTGLNMGCKAAVFPSPLRVCGANPQGGGYARGGLSCTSCWYLSLPAEWFNSRCSRGSGTALDPRRPQGNTPRRSMVRPKELLSMAMVTLR